MAEALDERPPAIRRTFVIFMGAYAGDVLSGVLSCPYTDEDARRYARACLAATLARGLVACVTRHAGCVSARRGPEVQAAGRPLVRLAR